jgi:tetratricopeptide (TPR) repeat protein
MLRLFAFAATAALLAGCTIMPTANSRSTATVASTDDSETGIFAAYLSARFAAGDHDLKSAAHYYGQTLKADPQNGDLQALSFFYSATSGDFAAAQTYANNVVAVTPDDRAARLALAVIAFKRKDYAGARNNLSLSAKGSFTVLTLSLFDAWAAAAIKDQAGVEKDLAALAAEKGAEGMAAFHMALLAEYSGNVTAAETAYKQALKDGATPRVLEGYGRMLERSGRAPEAAALYNAHLGQDGFDTITGPGLRRIAAGTKPDALVATPSEGAAEALFGLAASLTDESSADVSVLYLRMALYLRPDFALAQFLLGDRFDRLDKYDDAIAVYRTVDSASPYRRMAMMQVALDETRMGKNDDAIADFKKLAAASPADAEVWTALGDAYRSAERDSDAVGAYDSALKAIGTPRTQDWSLFFARATVKDHMKDWQGAEADASAALKLSPNEPQLLNYLGYSWVDRGERIPEALAMLEKARSLRPYDGYVVDSVGWAYFKLGRYDDAARTLEQAVLLVPGDPTINEHLGDALWRSGKHIDARFQWNHAIAFGADDQAKAEIEQKLKTGLAG